MASGNVGTLTVRLIATAAQFERVLASAAKTMEATAQKFQRISDRMETLGQKMMLGVTTPLGTAAGAALKLAGDMEQTRIAFTNMLGSAEEANKFISQLEDFAEKTPFNFSDLVNSTRVLKTFGFSVKELIPMLTAIGDAIAAMGGNKEMVQRVVNAIGQMRAKHRVSAEEMLQLTEAGIRAWDYLAEAIGVSVPEVQKLAAKGLIPAERAINIILAGMERDFGGMMVQQSKTLTGSFSNLWDAIERFGRSTGNAINQTFGLTEKIQWLAAAIEFAADALNNMNPSLRNFLVYIATFALVVGPGVFLLGFLARVASHVATGFSFISKFVSNAIFAFSAWRAGAATLGEALVFLAGGKIPLIIFAILAVVVITVVLILYWDKLAAIGKAIWTRLAAIFVYVVSLYVRGLAVIASAIGFLIPAFRRVGESLYQTADRLKASAISMWASASTATKSSANIKKVAENHNAIAESAENAAASQEKLGDSIKKSSKSANDNIQSFDNVHQIQQEMADTAEKGAAAIPGSVAVPNASLPQVSIADMVGNIRTGVDDMLNNFNRLQDGISQAGAKIHEFFDRVRQKWAEWGPLIEKIVGVILVVLIPALILLGIIHLVNAIQMAASWLIAFWPVALIIAIVLALVTFIALKWDWIKQKTTEVWTAIKNWVTEKFTALREKANEIFTAIKNVIKKIWDNIELIFLLSPFVMIITGKWDDVKKKVDKIITTLKQKIEEVWNGIKDYFVNLPIVKSVTDHWENIRQKTIEKWNAIKDDTKNIWDGIIAGIKGAWNGIKDYFVNLPIVKSVTDHWENIRQKTIEKWNAIKDGIKNIWDGIIAGIKGAINSVIRAMNRMIDGLNSIRFNIPDWVPVIGGKRWGFHIPHIPYLAEGGIVTKPTLAMVGERGPEVVRPLEREEMLADEVAKAVYTAIMDATRIRSVSSDTGGDREIVLKIDGVTIGRVLFPILQKEAERRGVVFVR